MIKGKLRKYAPFFDKENEEFGFFFPKENQSERLIPREEFTTDADSYFREREELINLEPWEKLGFDLNAYFDLLSGMGYVFNKQNHPHFEYPEDLSRFFLSYFHRLKFIKKY